MWYCCVLVLTLQESGEIGRNQARLGVQETTMRVASDPMRVASDPMRVASDPMRVASTGSARPRKGPKQAQAFNQMVYLKGTSVRSEGEGISPQIQNT